MAFLGSNEFNDNQDAHGGGDCGSDNSVIDDAVLGIGGKIGGTLIGGKLDGLDLQTMNIDSAIKMSMLQAFIDGDGAEWLDIVVNGNNEFETVSVGGFGGANGGVTDIYYEIQTSTDSPDQKISSVTIVGGKPRTSKRIGPPVNLLTSSNSTTLSSNDYTTTYIYKASTSDQGYPIDDIYLGLGPWEEIAGFAYDITGLSDSATLVRNATTVVPVSVPATFSIGTGEDSITIANSGYNAYTTSDGILSVQSVYVIGTRVDDYYTTPESNGAATSSNSGGRTWMVTDHDRDEYFELAEGTDYTVKMSDRVATITFLDRSSPKDRGSYGTETNATSHPSSIYDPGVSSTIPFFPTAHSGGISVKEIIVACEVDAPSMTVTDPTGETGSITYNVSPIRVNRPPAPIAVNGIEIDQTVEDALETALCEHEGGQGITLTLAFLGGSTWSKDNDLSTNTVAEASLKIYNMLTSNGADSTETTYICGPFCNPSLGGGDATGTINRISHSYSDQGSYTVSVTTGAAYQPQTGGLTGIDNSATPRAAEARQVHGTVKNRAPAGGGYYFVNCNEYGDVLALNCQDSEIRAGDGVSVTIYGQPTHA